MTDAFQTHINEERERLNRQREEILTQQQRLKEQLDANAVELKAIDAYHMVKAGNTSSKRSQRTKGRREQVLQLLRESVEGLNRSQLLEACDAKGNKSGEQSISNALTNLKKQKRVIAVEDGRYRAA